MYKPMENVCALCGEALVAVAQDTYKCIANCQSQQIFAMTNTELANALNPQGAGIELSIRIEAARRLKIMDDVLEAVSVARTHLDDSALKSVTDQIRNDGHDGSRAICATFFDYDKAVEKLVPPTNRQLPTRE